MTPDPKAVSALAEVLARIHGGPAPWTGMRTSAEFAAAILSALDPRDLLSPEDRAALLDGLALHRMAADCFDPLHIEAQRYLRVRSEEPTDG